MSKIDDLITQYCPNGVQYKKIEEIANYRRGSFPQPYGERKWYDGEGAMPFVQVVDVGEDMRLVDDTKNKISKLAQPKSVFVPTGTVIVSLQGSIGRVAITQYDSYVDRTLGIFTEYKIDIDKKYFAYQLQNKFGIEKEFARGSTIKTITKEEFSLFEIPVPPMAVQEEIVRILDAFTELEKELEKRKQQYEYYRNKLLNPENMKGEVKFKTLDEVCETITDYVAAGSFADIKANVSYLDIPDYAQLVRTTDIKNKFNNTGFVYVDEKAFKYLWRVNLDRDVIILPNIGVNCGEVYYINPKDLPYKNNVLGPNAILVRSSTANNYFLKFIFEEKYFQKELNKIISSGGQPKFNKTELKKIIIPIPSIEEQERIVSILDKFDALVNDISIGLPAEINARRQQYEYYRDKLLTFEEAA